MASAAAVHAPTAAVPLVDALAGLASGVAGLTISQPFDTLRVRAQVLQQPLRRSLYGTVYRAGVRGLYRGVVPSLCTTVLVSTTVFTSLEFAKRRISTLCPAFAERSPLLTIFLAGGYSGFAASVLTSPLHRVKVQLQARELPGRQGPSTGHTVQSAVRCARAVLRFEGLRGMYLGWRVQMLSESLGRGVYFGTYEMCKRVCWPNAAAGEARLGRRRQRRRQPRPTPPLPSGNTDDITSTSVIPLAGRVASGAASGLVGWTVIYPVDVVKNRIQAQAVGTGAKMPWSTVVRRLWEADGPAAFFRGWSVMALRALPVSSIALPVYDLTHMWLQEVV